MKLLKKITIAFFFSLILVGCSNDIELTNETAKNLIKAEFNEYCYDLVRTNAADIPTPYYKDARKAIGNFKKLQSLGLINLNKRNGRWGNKPVDDYSWTPTKKGEEYKRKKNNSKSYVYYATLKSMGYEITGVSINQENKTAKVFF